MQNALNSKADASDIPTKTSDLTNDSGFITSSSLPTKVSDLTNDSGFITNTVNNLTNYYTKTNTYTKSEVDSLIGSVSSLDIQIVQTLPTQDISTSTIYLVPKTSSTNDNYDEYIYVNNSWEHIGSTEVDLSNYYTKTQTDNLLDDKADANSLSTVATTGSYNDLSNKPTIPTKTSDLTNDSGFIDGLEILSYGNSTWNDFITAYQKNKVVYCRASSNSNPASGSQTRLAFMAYVNNATSPTEVEFQYYRSVSSHTDSQQGDQVFVYKLTSAGSWTVITRNAFSKVVAGTGLSSSYSNGAITLSANSQTETDPVFTASAASGIASSDITNWNSKQTALVSGTNIKTINNESLLGSGNINITSGGGTMVDMRVNGSSIVDSNNVGNIATEGTYNATTNKIATMSDVPDELADLTGDSTHRTVTDTEKNTWNNKSNFSGSYNDLTNKPTLFSGDYDDLTNKPTIPDELADLSDDSTHRLVTDTEKSTWNSKQAALVSGTNIKTINNTSLLGSGNISVATASDIPTKTSDLTNDSGFTGVYDATSIVAAAGSTITDAQYTELANAINNNSQIIVSYLGNTAACGRVMDFGPNIVLSWIQYDKFYMLTVHSASGNVHNVTLDINNKQLAFADDIPEDVFVDGDFLIQSLGSTITNEQYEEIITNLQNGKIYKIYGVAATFDYLTKDGVGYRVAYLPFGGLIREIWISVTNNNHAVTMEQTLLATTSDLASKQDSLVSGTNIKTVNNQSLLGSGDISITGGASNIENGTEEGDLQQTGSTASGGYSFAEGFLTTASGEISHTEGFQTTASGAYSHAEGNYTKAIGENSHAEGNRTTASGRNSHSEGSNTTASGDYQHVFGKYNVIDNNSTYVEIVGNGNYNEGTQTETRANARTLDWNGNEVLAGKLTVGANPTANMDVATKQYVDNLNTYSTNEIKVGTWINNKPIYRKVINFGALPNATTKNVAHNISNMGMITNIRGVAFNPSANTYLPLPYATTTATQCLQLYATTTNVTANTGFNLSIYTTTYIILEYTKTTD